MSGDSGINRITNIIEMDPAKVYTVMINTVGMGVEEAMTYMTRVKDVYEAAGVKVVVMTDDKAAAKKEKK